MAVQRDKVIASAEKLVARGKVPEAIKEYERLVEDSPNDVNTLNRIGDLWVRVNNNAEAVKVYTKIADHYSKDGFFLKAIAIYKKINKLDPSKLDIYAKLADLYAKQGLAMEAKSQYQVLADYYLKHGEPGSALTIYRKITELDPNSINVHVKLADLYSQNGQTAEALKEYDRVGRMLLKRGMLDEAVQVFKKALRIDGKNIELVESLVTALLESRDYTNATTIVEQSLEVNRDHPRLLGLWSRIQLAKGDASSARSTLERALAANPDEPILRETLADIYLRQSNPDKALEMLAPIAEKAIARGERNLAVETLTRVLRVSSGHTGTLEKLLNVYLRLNEETNILSAMNSLAEAHVARGSYREAAAVLEQLVEREPQNAQHRNKLQFVRSNISGVETLPGKRTGGDVVESPPPPPMPSLEIEEPMPSFELELDSAEPIDFDLAAGPASGSSPAANEPSYLRSAVDIAAADIAAEQDSDVDFITEHLTEAEVFAKYGLSEKAIEHLRAVLERSKKNLTAHERLFRLLLDEGTLDEARAAAAQYVAALSETGDETAIAAVKQEFSARGQSFDAPAPKAPPRVPPPAARPAPARPRTIERPVPPPVVEEEPEITLELDEPAAEIGFDLEPAAGEFAFDAGEATDFTDLATASDTIAAQPFVTPTEKEGAPTEELLFQGSELSFELDEEPPPAVVPLEAPETVSTFDFGLATEEEMAAAAKDQPFFGVEGGDELSPAFAEEEPAGDDGLPSFGEAQEFYDGPSPEEVGEIDFYIAQEMYDEARQRLSALAALYPSSLDLQERQQQIEAASATAGAPTAAAPSQPSRPPALSRAEIENELLSAIPDDDDDFVAAPPPPASAPAASAPLAMDLGEDNLFADEDDFFDLAAELESEMTEEGEPLALSEEEQSLEQIFKEFKKGVEQQLDSEDYDTHYNLGIAYKEMGLTDEAIGEFQLASKDPKRAVECASMLGLCFLEKGMPQLAIKWYRKGLEMPEINEDEHVGLLYDLGSAYMEVGDTQNAQKAFMEVYGMNTNYRDVVTRMKQLENAR